MVIRLTKSFCLYLYLGLLSTPFIRKSDHFYDTSGYLYQMHSTKENLGLNNISLVKVTDDDMDDQRFKFVRVNLQILNKGTFFSSHSLFTQPHNYVKPVSD